jgi:hypothetical protein
MPIKRTPHPNTARLSGLGWIGGGNHRRAILECPEGYETVRMCAERNGIKTTVVARLIHSMQIPGYKKKGDYYFVPAGTAVTDLGAESKPRYLVKSA